jgi:PAS domain S-box-containing protein
LVDFAALFDASPNPYMVVDAELRYLAVNAAYLATVGANAEALIGRHLFERFPGDVDAAGQRQAERVRASIERVFATGRPDVLALIPFSIARETPEGPVMEERYWSATHTPLFDAQGRVEAVLQHTTDVTDLQRLRAAGAGAGDTAAMSLEQLQEGILSRTRVVQDENRELEARRRALMSMFEQAPGFIAVVRGADYRYEVANRAYEDLVDRHDLIGRSAPALLPELVQQGYFELLDRVRATGEPFIGRGMPATIHAPGEAEKHLYVDFVFQPVRDATGVVDAVFIQGADVTERESAIAALRASEARLRDVVDRIPQMVWSTSPDGMTDFYNRQWYAYTGMPEGATDGEHWVDVFHPEDRRDAWDTWRHCVQTGEPYEIEYRLRHASGEYRWVLGRALPLRDESGRIVRWMGTCTEIHEQKLAQQALECSQAALREADRRKDQFLATLAHELRNPLAPIAMAAELLRRAGDEPARVAQASEIIARQAAHMTHLVNDLLDVSRVTRGLVTITRAPVDLVACLHAAIEQVTPLIQRRGHRLESHLPEAPFMLLGDGPRLTQIFANLLTNAAKYTPDGGRIGLALVAESDGARVSVRDDGIGIHAALLPQVFDLFTQGETTLEQAEGGLGIGLALVRSLVALHGGRIEASSAGEGQGSCFEVWLPLRSEAAAG